MTPEMAIALSLGLPLLGAIGILLTGRWPNLRESITVTISLLTFGVVLTLIDPVMAGARPAWSVFQVMPGVTLAFEVEPLGMLYALVASSLWIPTGLYCIGYCRGHHEKNQTRFFACFAWLSLPLSGSLSRKIYSRSFSSTRSLRSRHTHW